MVKSHVVTQVQVAASLIKNIIILIVMFSSLLTFGSEDSLFIDRPSKFTITPNILLQNLDLTINGAHGSIVSFEPGKTVAVGGTLYYKWFVGSLYYGVYNEFNKVLEDKTRYYDFRFNFTKRRGELDLYFQWFKGFSIKDLPKASDGSVVNLAKPNLDLFSTGFNFYYSINPKHSVQSVYKYNELQTRSSGSLMLGLSQNYTHIMFDNSIFPDDIVTGTEQLGEENDGKFIALIPTIGYQVNLIKNKFNISPIVNVGIGEQYQDYMSDAKGDFRGVNSAMKYNIDVPIGINNENNYFGIIGRYDKSIFFLEKGVEIHYELITAKIFFGIRF